MFISTTATICVLFLIVSFLYSSIGHGGASGYMAVMSFFAFTAIQMSTTALILDVLVSSIAFISFYRERHFSWRLALPFIISSVPMAFIGGTFTLSTRSFSAMLAGVLLFAAFRLIIEIKQRGDVLSEGKFPPIAASLTVGAIIGFVSGIVGLGGGIFLSPLILLIGWADPKRTAGISAVFILANSLAGLAGRLAAGSIQLEGLNSLLPFIISALIGGLAGSYFGSKRFSALILRRLLGIVLIIAAVKLLVAAFK